MRVLDAERVARNSTRMGGGPEFHLHFQVTMVGGPTVRLLGSRGSGGGTWGDLLIRCTNRLCRRTAPAVAYSTREPAAGPPTNGAILPLREIPLHFRCILQRAEIARQPPVQPTGAVWVWP